MYKKYRLQFSLPSIVLTASLSIVIGFFLWPVFFANANNKASDSIEVSLTVGAYIKCTVSGDEMTVMTNSKTPVFVTEDEKAFSEKAVFGKLAKIKIKKNSIYTILADI